MKKLFAILLVVAMLIPMGLTVQAEEITAKPFYISNWKNGETKYSHVYEAAYFWSNSKNVAEGEAHVTAPRLPGGGSSNNIPLLAENLKKEFDTYPEGARNVTLCLVHDAMIELAEYCFSDKAIPLVNGFLEEFLAEYSRIGGKLDSISVDIEYLDIYYHYIETNYYSKGDKDVYKKIEQHATYQNVIRPQLVERGFKFYENVTDVTPELYAIHPNSGSQYATSRAIWNTVMRNYQCQVVTDCCAPLWKYYPNATVNDYKGKDTMAWMKEVSDSGGNQGGGGNYYTSGNCGNINFYFVRPSTSFFAKDEFNTVVGYNNAIMEENAFTRFLFDMDIAKSAQQSSQNGRMTYVLSHPFYGEARAKTPYYAETTYHLGLMNPEYFLGYILQQDCKTDGVQDVEKFEQAMKIANQTMVELTRVAGFSDRQTIYAEKNWNHNFVLSGMYANGRNIWRLTPDMSKEKLSDYIVQGSSDLTFQIGGETVTFPGGKIIEDSAIDVIGTWGFWIETAANVTPTITRGSDYYRNYPAFLMTFDDIELGKGFDFNTAKPAGVWAMKKQSGSSSEIVTDPQNPGNKMAAFKGTYNATLTTLLANISSGDGYAENQAWEISVQLPADLAADAEIVLLKAANEKRKSNDGGFKITGGKVYYSREGEYVEMTGVTLAADTRYRFVRDIDFNDPENFTCDYYIYAADGTVVGKAMDVPIEELVLPVYSAFFGCVGVAGEAVLFDDYKFYATQVTTDYFLYDAKTGMKVTEMDKARAGDTAFRLSWMNATNTEKTYTVIAAYYDGETKVSEEVVKEIKMASNTDGVTTGVVKNKEGKTMLVYLKDNNVVETPDAPATNTEPTVPGTVPETAPVPTGEPEAPANNSKLVIIIAAVAAVVIVAVVVIVVASKKKKKAAGEPAAEEKPEE